MRALVIAMALAGCTGSMEAYFAQDVVDEQRDLRYAPGDDPRQLLDLYLPRGLSGYPVVVFIHGGFWIHQSKDFFEPVVGLYRNVGIALARRGIGTAVIDYRLVPAVTFDAQYADVATAIRFVEDRLAPAHVVIAGHSAGGHLAALAAFDEPRLAAAGVDTSVIAGYAPLSPILDLGAMAASGTTNADIVHEVFGDDLTTDAPVTYFAAAVKPLLIVLGGDDEPFLLDQVPAAIDRLHTLGAPVTSASLPGHTHDDIVLDFDTDHDAITPVLAPFVADVCGVTSGGT